MIYNKTLNISRFSSISNNDEKASTRNKQMMQNQKITQGDCN